MRGISLRAAGLILAVVLVLVLAVGPVYASSSAQQGGVTVYTLQPGESAEWIFNYTDDSQPGILQLSSDQNNAVALKVYTDAGWAALGAGNSDIDPVGQGTQRTQKNSDGTTDILFNGDLFWETNSSAPGTFHAQVVSSSTTPIHYTLTQSGAGAGGLAPFGAAAPVPLPAAVAQPTAAAAATSQAPTTLPQTGGAEYLLLLGAGSALVAAGWLARRRAN